MSSWYAYMKRDKSLSSEVQAFLLQYQDVLVELPSEVFREFLILMDSGLRDEAEKLLVDSTDSMGDLAAMMSDIADKQEQVNKKRERQLKLIKSLCNSLAISLIKMLILGMP